MIKSTSIITLFNVFELITTLFKMISTWEVSVLWNLQSSILLQLTFKPESVCHFKAICNFSINFDWMWYSSLNWLLVTNCHLQSWKVCSIKDRWYINRIQNWAKYRTLNCSRSRVVKCWGKTIYFYIETSITQKPSRGGWAV